MPSRPQRAGVRRQREAVPRKRYRLTLSKPGVRDRSRTVLKAFELQLV
ncbi:transcriptional regulator [Luteimonas composti]|uniref:Transcriptional regulator n=1 Tax=Luteimonas composti TaxID=398257 RepID=A0ABT6MVP5_9GAMM|nr:transcriptional regulator [Luteimonas composti]MDH7454696.1 transcriptional regulator [Luteimonas composti]